MTNSIASIKNYTAILDEIYQRAGVSNVLNSGRRMVRAGRNAKEIMIPKIQVTGLGDYTRNVGYKTGSITYEYETKTFNYDRGIRLMADVMDVEEAGVLDCFVEAGAELQRTQVAPEADAFTFAEIAGHTSVEMKDEDLSSADAEDVLESLRTVTSAMDENQVVTGSRLLFITPTLKGVLDDFSFMNPNRSNRVMERFSRVVEVPQVRFYTAIDLLSGEDDGFGYAKATGGRDINFMVVEKSAVIKFDKHVASRVFRPDELESLDSYMMKYRKYGIVELFDNKLDGIYVSASAATMSLRVRKVAKSKVSIAELAANQDVVTVSQSGNTVTITQTGALSSFSGGDGSHEYIALDVNTGLDSIVGATWDGAALTADDAAEAAVYGLGAGHIVYFAECDQLTSPREITIGKTGYSNYKLTVRFVPTS